MSIPKTRNAPRGYFITFVELVIVALSLSYAFSSSFVALILWIAVSCAYLIIGFVVMYRSSLDPRRAKQGRVGILDTLSWVLPVAASISGVNSAVIVLLNRSAIPSLSDDSVVIAALGSVGIIISWLMLQAGFANVYEAVNTRLPGLAFPATKSPTFADYLYFSFAIGSSFATSDTQIRTQQMRLTVTVHSVVSFFYNAMVVAIAFQVLQQLTESQG